MQKVSLLTIGNEVVDGRIVNTNASWLAHELKQAGFLPSFVTSCRDNEEEIEDTLRYLSDRSDFIITTGGLGPTSDDLTRQAVAKFTRSPLVLNDNELSKLKAYYKSRGRKFDNDNSIQAHFPDSATVLPNEVGTAPGFFVEQDNSPTIFSLPGVPKELKHLILHHVLPILRERSPAAIAAPEVHTLHCFGIPESKAGRTVSDLEIDKDDSELGLGGDHRAQKIF